MNAPTAIRSAWAVLVSCCFDTGVSDIHTIVKLFLDHSLVRTEGTKRSIQEATDRLSLVVERSLNLIERVDPVHVGRAGAEDDVVTHSNIGSVPISKSEFG